MSQDQQAANSLDTFPKLLMEHARQRGHKPALREKDFGIWQQWTWRVMPMKYERWRRV